MQQQKLKELIAEEKKLEQKIEALKKDNLNNNEKQKQLDPQDQALLDKQKELEKLFNEILTPEMKEQIRKLEELLKQQNKEAIQQQLEKMDKSNEDVKKQIDRTLEQFKRKRAQDIRNYGTILHDDHGQHKNRRRVKRVIRQSSDNEEESKFLILHCQSLPRIGETNLGTLRDRLEFKDQNWTYVAWWSGKPSSSS